MYAGWKNPEFNGNRTLVVYMTSRRYNSCGNGAYRCFVVVNSSYSYVNSCTVLKPYLTHTRKCTQAGENPEFTGNQTLVAM